MRTHLQAASVSDPIPAAMQPIPAEYNRSLTRAARQSGHMRWRGGACGQPQPTSVSIPSLLAEVFPRSRRPPAQRDITNAVE